MPTYEFESEDGRIIEQYHGMSTVPDTVEKDGVVYRRIISGTGMISMGELGHQDKYPYCSNSLPRWTPGCKYDKKGRPVVQSRKHEKELQARYDLVKD